MSISQELYQQVILDHNKKPRNFCKLEGATHHAEGFNPVCGDHLHVYMVVSSEGIIEKVSFEGDGCAISRASASMMTEALVGAKIDDAHGKFEEFQSLVKGELDPAKDDHQLGKLKIFGGIWQYPARVKCAALAWHAMKGALNSQDSVSTE